MKKLFKKSVLSGAIIALGVAVGCAEIIAFQGLDAILDNFDYILNLNTSKQAEIDGYRPEEYLSFEYEEQNINIEEYKKSNS